MRIDILSLFPDYFTGPFDTSIIKRAREKGLVDIHLVNIRDFALPPHFKVDDRPYGGGPGMVMMCEPLEKALLSVKKPSSLVVYMTPQGAPLQAEMCREFSSFDHLIIICGHYEGVDQRFIDLYVEREISIGDYVLTNGCLAAIVLVDATVRLIPNVLGNELSAEEDSFEDGLDFPHFTRPELYRNLQVPSVLLSGNHQKIKEWRKSQALEKTRKYRPDILK